MITFLFFFFLIFLSFGWIYLTKAMGDSLKEIGYFDEPKYYERVAIPVHVNNGWEIAIRYRKVQ